MIKYYAEIFFEEDYQAKILKLTSDELVIYVAADPSHIDTDEFKLTLVKVRK